MLKPFAIPISMLLGAALFVAPVPHPSVAGAHPGFDVGSLRGSYGSIGRAGAAASVSVGVAVFHGDGRATRTVRVNAAGPGGDRVLIDITSVGTYSVGADGGGVLVFDNTFADGSMNRQTFDFVITKTGESRRNRSLPAEEFFAIDREPGVTASPVTESFTLRTGAR